MVALFVLWSCLSIIFSFTTFRFSEIIELQIIIFRVNNWKDNLRKSYLGMAVVTSSCWNVFIATNWLKHWATIRKFAGSIPDGFMGITHLLNPSRRNMARHWNEYHVWSKGDRWVSLTTLPPFCADCLEILEAYQSPQGLSRPVLR